MVPFMAMLTEADMENLAAYYANPEKCMAPTTGALASLFVCQPTGLGLAVDDKVYRADLPAAVVDDQVHKGLTEALQLAVTDTVDRQHFLLGHRRAVPSPPGVASLNTT